jgi:cyclase
MRQATLIRISTVLVAAAGLWVAFTQPQQPPPDLTVEKIADDLHVLVGSGGNVAVYTTSEGVILVDDKFEPNVPQIVAKVKSITDQPIRYVLNTHQHGDHTGGNRKLMQDQKVEVISHKNARANMVSQSMPGLARVVFSEETAVFLGGKEVRARYFSRGHTNGDVVIYFPAHKVVHMGDMFTAAAPFIDYASGGSGIAWTDTLDAALKMDVETVIPGHGPIMKPKDLASYRNAIDALRARIRDLQRQGKKKEEVAGLLKLEEMTGWKPNPTWMQRTLPLLYDELAR